MLSWDVGKINPQKLPSLKGTMSLQAGASKPDENPTINIQLKIQQMAISGAHIQTHTNTHVCLLYPCEDTQVVGTDQNVLTTQKYLHNASFS